MLDEVVTPDVFTASRTLREINSFTRDDGTPLNYTLVNIKDLCKNHLNDEHIQQIIDAYQHRRKEERDARRVEMEEIKKNDFNLNLSRYVSTAKPEPEIDMIATHQHLIAIEEEIQKGTAKHNAFLDELGVPTLP